MKKINTTLLLLLTFNFFQLKAQDLIIRTTGDTIKGKITEIGTNAISYKRADNANGPTFVENKSNIVMIKMANGEIQKLTPSINTSTASIMTNTSVNTNSAVASNTIVGSSEGKVKIERTGNKYTIDGQKASRKMVNEQLGKSKNPAIVVPLKATKMMGGAQKIVKLTSIPSTIGGGFTFLWKGVDMWNDIQRGRATTSSYVNAALSLVGTLTLPITNKILKKKSNKMYDKLIDLYNVTN